jgi:hypothetical protein
MQANGGEMLRIAAVKLCEAGMVPCMLIHDGILLELNTEEQCEAAAEIMRAAGREVCGDLTIDVDADQKLLNGARYKDKRAGKMWTTMMNALRSAGVNTACL